jgi:hypothetical protein
MQTVHNSKLLLIRPAHPTEKTYMYPYMYIYSIGAAIIFETLIQYIMFTKFSYTECRIKTHSNMMSHGKARGVCCSLAVSPHQIKIIETHFVDPQTSNILHNLPFCKNHPLKSGDIQWVRILKNKMKNLRGHLRRNLTNQNIRPCTCN